MTLCLSVACVLLFCYGSSSRHHDYRHGRYDDSRYDDSRHQYYRR